MAQANLVLNALTAAGAKATLVGIESTGDTNTSSPLYAMEGESPGVFAKQLQEALRRGEIDLAVHSLKDLPTQLPTGLSVAAISKREWAGDCLVVRSHPPAGELPLRSGATVGTSSLRREAQFLSRRPDLKVISIRGNVPTRVQAVLDGKVDGVVLAQAGLRRLDLALSGVVQVDLPSNHFVGAPGQGAIAVESRSTDSTRIHQLLNLFHHSDTAEEVGIERRILQALEGGCSLPLGVRCRVDRVKGSYHVQAFLGHYQTDKAGARSWLGFHPLEETATQADDMVNSVVGTYKGILDA